MTTEEAAATLLIRHLPEAIPAETLSRLFSHYGASSVRTCTHGSVKNCAFVDFKDEALAYQAHRQLNGLRFLGKILSVEKASKRTDEDKHRRGEPGGTGKDSISLNKDGASHKDVDGSSLSYRRNEPIAERLGLDYPFPPHLEYAYPPPDGHILTNIVNALIAVPRFYTQVLHLMNKMNIPAPFRTALPTPPLPTPSFQPPPPPPPPPTDIGSRAENLSSSESEMESSDEETPSVGAPKRKHMKREAIIGPAGNKDVAHETVGLKPAVLLPKERPIIKKKNPVLQIKIAPKQVQCDVMDDDSTREGHGQDEEKLDDKPVLTIEELKSGKLVPEEILSLPVFKNYSVGNPSRVLYIKNLARDVIADDFYFIFGSFFGSNDAARSSLTVKLMQEGRMRGQAFVTFPSVELAQNALNLVNGYVFKGKPIVIQFGRNPATATS